MKHVLGTPREQITLFPEAITVSTKPLHLPDAFFAFTSLYNCSMTILLQAR